MKKMFKNRIFTLVLLLIILGSVSIVVADILYANDVEYSPNDNTWTVDNVSDALDEVYTKTKLMETYRNEICPGCVYRKSSSFKYNITSPSESKTEENTKLTSGEYTTDYKTLNSNFFLGHIIDENGYILATYACGLNNGTFFCLRGVDSDQGSLTYKPFYREAVNRLNVAFPSCNASATSGLASCNGGMAVYAYPNGDIYVYSGSDNCMLFNAGYSFCDLH